MKIDNQNGVQKDKIDYSAAGISNNDMHNVIENAFDDYFGEDADRYSHKGFTIIGDKQLITGTTGKDAATSAKEIVSQIKSQGAKNIVQKNNSVSFDFGDYRVTFEIDEHGMSRLGDVVLISESDGVTKTTNGEDNQEFLDAVALYEGVYHILYGDCKYNINEDELTLEVQTSNRKFILHFEENGEVDFTEYISDDDYSLSEGKYGKNRDEAVDKIVELLTSHGAKNAELINNQVVANFEGEQQVYKLDASGKIVSHEYIVDPKKFIPTSGSDDGGKKTPAEQYINTYRQIIGDKAKYEVIDSNTVALKDSSGNLTGLVIVNDNCRDVKYLSVDDIKNNNDSE